MLLRNWYNILLWWIANQAAYTPGTYGAGSMNIKAANGSIVTPGQYEYPLLCSTDTALTYDLQLGTGTTAVTFDDYQLASKITSGITKSNAKITVDSSSYNSSTKKWTPIVQCDVTNTGSSAITVNEIGVANDLGHLVYREVLSSPITIAAGQRVTFIRNIEVQFPG